MKVELERLRSGAHDIVLTAPEQKSRLSKLQMENALIIAASNLCVVEVMQKMIETISYQTDVIRQSHRNV